MPRDLLMIDDAGSARSHLAETLKNGELLEHNQEAGNGGHLFDRFDAIGCHMRTGIAPPGRHQIPADDGFPVRVERYKSIGSKNRNLNMESSESGGSEHLSKPIDIDKLAARVKMHLRIKALQDELNRSENLFREFSVTDPLKNSFNRRNTTQILNNELTRRKRINEALPFIIHDMENFKKVNDLCGQLNGDEASTKVADAIRAKRSYVSTACSGAEVLGIVSIYA